jgi:hypothetical protein
MSITPGFYAGISGGAGGSNLASIATVYGPTPPLTPSFGQVWVDTTDPLRPVTNVWTSPGQWTKTSDGVTNTYVSLDAPLNPDKGDSWYEEDTNTFYVWDGLVWRPISGGGGGGPTTGIISYTVAPTPGPKGAVYYNSTDSTLYVSNGTTWEEVLFSPDKDTNSITAIIEPTARVDGSTLQSGDLWVNTDLNQINYWDDLANAWVRIASASAGDTHSFYQPLPPVLRPNNEALLTGDVWIKSTNSQVYVWEGTMWVPVAYADDANTNSILSPIAPTQRPTGDVLVQGDLWVNTTTSQTYYWNGAIWSPIFSLSTDIMSLLSGAAPILRPDSSPLQAGDQWVNSTTGALSYYDGFNWFPVSLGNDTHSIFSASMPTARPNTDPLQVGDNWVNPTTLRLSVWTGTAWAMTTSSNDTHSFTGATAPTITVRPDTSPLQAGDQYVNSTDKTLYYYTGTAWQLISGDSHSFTGTGAPTIIVRPDSSALQAGDQWIDTATDVIYYWTGTVWKVLSDDTHCFSGIAAPTLTARPNGEALKTGDQFVNTTADSLHYWNGTAWEAFPTAVKATPNISGVVFAWTPDGTDNGTYLGHNAGAFAYGGLNDTKSVGVGKNALYEELGVNIYNVAVGFDSGRNIRTGAGNALIGGDAGKNIEGSNNTFVGRSAGVTSISGQHNTFIGAYSGFSATAATGNTVIGSYNMAGEDTATNQVILARSFSGSSNTTKVFQINENNAYGIPTTNGSATVNYGLTGEILTSQGTGAPPIWATAGGGVAATPNILGTVYAWTPNTATTHIGFNSGLSSQTGGVDTWNTGVGVNALRSAATANTFNVAVGLNSLFSLTTGSINVAVGGASGVNITSGLANVLVGWAAGEDLTTHSRNTYIGYEAGRSNVADNSTFIGFRAGHGATAANGNTVIGSCTLADDPTVSNSVILARTSTTSNKVFQINGSNAFGIPTTNGSTTVNYGTSGQVLTSQGSTAPPIWSTPASVGGFTISDRTGASGTTPNPGQYVVVDTTTGTHTIGLPVAPPVGSVIVVADAKGNSATNNITVNAFGGLTIRGASSYLINVNWRVVLFRYTGVAGTGWTTEVMG